MRRGSTVFTVITIRMLAACQGSGDEASQAAGGSGAVGEGIEVDEAAVTGTVRFSGFRSSDAEEELLQATLDAFSEKYPNIEVDYEPIPEGYIDQMTAQFRPASPGSVLHAGRVRRCVDGRRAPRAAGSVLRRQPGVRHRAVLRSADPAFEYEGQTYGLPKDASPLALFYNPDMLEAAGVEPPTTSTPSRRPPRR